VGLSLYGSPRNRFSNKFYELWNKQRIYIIKEYKNVFRSKFVLSVLRSHVSKRLSDLALLDVKILK